MLLCTIYILLFLWLLNIYKIGLHKTCELENDRVNKYIKVSLVI